ncbi:nucleotide exchange factor GrpE [bacterium]|nr:nucleotide exchange factor GrpE [bacterium]
MVKDNRKDIPIKTAREIAEREAAAMAKEAEKEPEAPQKPEPAPPEKPAAPSVAISQDELDSLRAKAKERDELKDRYLRSLAEFDNYQKRARREQERYREEATKDLLRELTIVADDLNAAIPALEKAETGLSKGVIVVRDQLLQVMAQRGVVPLGTKPGEPFDPDRHEAVMMADGPGLSRDEVGMVLREGYKLGNTILRPAAVQVRKASPAPPPSPNESPA